MVISVTKKVITASFSDDEGEAFADGRGERREGARRMESHADNDGHCPRACVADE